MKPSSIARIDGKGHAEAPAGRSNRYLSFDRVIVGPDSAVRGFQKARRGQSLDVRVNVATCGLAQQFHPLAGQCTGERIPALECQVALTKRFATHRAMSGIHETAGRLILDSAPNGDFHVCHLTPRGVRTSHTNLLSIVQRR
jgi:hypothetical protein